MSMKLRVVIPPHPLIGHWLSIIRIEATPPPIFSVGLEQLGKWLTYEAIRDWIPYKKEELLTSRGTSEGTLIDPNIPICIWPSIPGGFQMWQGAKELLPNSTICLGNIPTDINKKTGLIVYLDQISNGKKVINQIDQLQKLDIEPIQIRVISALCANDALKTIGEAHPELTIYTGCVDEKMTKNNEPIPGIGITEERLNTLITGSHYNVEG